MELLNHLRKLEKMRIELKKIVKKLGKTGVMDRAAKAIMKVAFQRSLKFE